MADGLDWSALAPQRLMGVCKVCHDGLRPNRASSAGGARAELDRRERETMPDGMGDARTFSEIAAAPRFSVE
jgi:hypothetical protein